MGQSGPSAEESTLRMFVLMFTPMAVVIMAVLAVSSHQLRPPSLGSFLDTIEISRRRFWFVRSVNRHLLPRKTRVESRQHKKRQKGRTDQAADDDRCQRFLDLGPGTGRKRHGHE